MLYPSLVVAILACIVASQAVVTGSFQVCQGLGGSEQAINILLVAFPNYEVIVLPSSEGLPHFKDVPWASIHSSRQLAHDDRKYHCDSRLQQCMFSLDCVWYPVR